MNDKNNEIDIDVDIETISLAAIKKELYKKILFAEYLLLELEEIFEKNIINKKKFEKEFEKEIERITKKKKNDEKIKEEKKEEHKIDVDGIDGIDEGIEIDLGKYKNLNEDEKEKEEKDKSIIEKLYRILALKFHPDKNPGNKEYEIIFKNINEYNKQKNLLFMIILCKKHDIKFNYKDISKSDQDLIDNNIKDIQDEIIKEKNKVHWLWFNSDEEKKKNIKQRFMDLNNLNNNL